MISILAIAGASRAQAADDGEKYALRYRFREGELVRWQVEHQATVRTTIGGTTQTADTDTSSVKVWKVTGLDDKGVATFEHSVERIKMRQQISGRQAEEYDSQSGQKPPPGFQHVADSVGVRLSVVRMDPHGRIIQRKNYGSQTQGTDSQMTIPLPENPVAVGESWAIPHDVDVMLENGGVKKIQTRQRFKLEKVSNGVATISVDTVVLTPIRNQPQIEAQLIQRQTQGTVRFDLEAGRILSQQMDLDKQVIGFRGEASVMHYQTRFTEKLMTDATTASRPQPAGPAPQ